MNEIKLIIWIKKVHYNVKTFKGSKNSSQIDGQFRDNSPDAFVYCGYVRDSINRYQK